MTEVPMVEAFRRRVSERPDAPALTVADATLSFAALDERTDRLARPLLPPGAGEGRLVTLPPPNPARFVAPALAPPPGGPVGPGRSPPPPGEPPSWSTPPSTPRPPLPPWPATTSSSCGWCGG